MRYALPWVYYLVPGWSSRAGGFRSEEGLVRAAINVCEKMYKDIGRSIYLINVSNNTVVL
jgi:hypothetical protein